MAVALTSKAGSYAELLTVLLIFVVVLAATALTTRWIANYQKKQGSAGNLELLDAIRMGNNKYLQIIRIGEAYVAVAVCKDTVTLLGEIPAEQMKRREETGSGQSFREILAHKKGVGETGSDEPGQPKDKET